VTLKSPVVTDAFLRCLEITTKPVSFYNRSIKALYLPYTGHDDGVEIAVKVLPYCQGVEYFVCWISPYSVSGKLTSLISTMRPRRFVAKFKSLLSTVKPDFSLPFFDNMTHIEITDGIEWECWSGIHRIPRLSHILFDMYGYRDRNLPNVFQAVANVLHGCGTLQVCVIRLSSNSLHQVAAAARVTNDYRMVFIMPSNSLDLDWCSFIGGQPDTWSHAENVVMTQRQEHRWLKPQHVHAG
jgi:hypothetical protein